MKHKEQNFRPPPHAHVIPGFAKETTTCFCSTPRHEDASQAANVTEYFKCKEAEVLQPVFSVMVEE